MAIIKDWRDGTVILRIDVALHNAALDCLELRYADLRGKDLRGANLIASDLRYADLRDCNLHHADMENCDLRHADLRGAHIRYAELRGSLLPNTDIVIASPWGWAHVQRANIRIGCQYHPTSAWATFTDDYIRDMAKGALTWWRRWRSALLSLAKACEPYRDNKEDVK